MASGAQQGLESSSPSAQTAALIAHTSFPMTHHSFQCNTSAHGHVPYLVSTEVTVQGCVIDSGGGTRGPVYPADLSGELIQHLQGRTRAMSASLPVQTRRSWSHRGGLTP